MDPNRRSALKELENERVKIRSTFILPFKESEKRVEVSNTESDYEEEDLQNFEIEFKKGNKKDFIMSLFPKKLYAQLYFAWCKDCSETISAENAKYFRDELMMRGNKDMKNFFFRSMRVNKNFLLAFVGNLESGRIVKLDLSDNLIADSSMHNIKNIISVKKVVHLNLASNMISTEGLKIIQNEVMSSDSLKYLNLGIIDGSFRRNNFSGEGGLIMARILLTNESLSTLILQDNELGEESADKIGSALIKNKILSKLKISDNKIRNRGAKTILENGDRLVSINLANNEITSEICLDLKKLLETSSMLQELNWDSNNIGQKGIKFVVEGVHRSKSIRHLSLKNTNIGNNGVKLLAEGLRNNKYLEVLDISSNSINLESFADICDSLMTNRITTIKAKNNLLGDESMEYFARTILAPETTSNITYFDFSSCKIYDQGLIYLLSELSKNTKITKIKLTDNYFSHEIDYVVIGFIEKNTSINYCNLSKNRFSFQCLQKIQKIVERNIKIQNEKEPNKLLIEVYRLKYENTKLNEMKDCLKYLENDVEKIKLNRADIRQDYESFKFQCDEDYQDIRRKVEKTQYLYGQRETELNAKLEVLNSTKSTNGHNLEVLIKKLNDLKEKKDYLEEENEKIRLLHETTEKEYMQKIEYMNNTINENKKKESEHLNDSKVLMEEIIKLDKLIKEKKK